MTDDEAIEHYNRGGDATRGAFAAVHWPDVPLTPTNLGRLVEGVLDDRCDCVRLAFGEDVETEALGERVTEAWRTDALQTRFAPEGVFVRAAFTVRVAIAPDGDQERDGNAEPMVETLAFAVEVCVSFTHRHHVRPFLDFMGGTVRRAGDGAVLRLDPFAREVSPADAVAWGVNAT
jgi:hypothetical protein